MKRFLLLFSIAALFFFAACSNIADGAADPQASNTGTEQQKEKIDESDGEHKLPEESASSSSENKNAGSETAENPAPPEPDAGAPAPKEPESEAPQVETDANKPEKLPDGTYRLFAPGVTMQTFFDANKNGQGDSQLCWAAVSANLVAWWQERYVADGKTLKDSLPRGADKIFEKFKSSWGDSEGTFLNGVLWYMAAASSTSKDAGGYLLEYIDTSKWRYPNITAYKYLEKFDTIEGFSSAVLSGLKNGAVALGITNREKNGTYGHAITIWGAEYSSDPNLIRALWVSDSDDEKTALVRYPVSQASGYVKIHYEIYPSYDKIKNIMVLYAP